MNAVANPVCWFELPVQDMERAMKFYESVFSITLRREAPAGFDMAIFSANGEKYGTNGALIQGNEYVPSWHGTLIYFRTASIEETLKKVTEAGGSICGEKKDIGVYGFIGFFKDTEGNRVGLHSLPAKGC